MVCVCQGHGCICFSFWGFPGGRLQGRSMGAFSGGRGWIGRIGWLGRTSSWLALCAMRDIIIIGSKGGAQCRGCVKSKVESSREAYASCTRTRICRHLPWGPWKWQCQLMRHKRRPSRHPAHIIPSLGHRKGKQISVGIRLRAQQDTVPHPHPHIRFRPNGLLHSVAPAANRAVNDPHFRTQNDLSARV